MLLHAPIVASYEVEQEKGIWPSSSLHDSTDSGNGNIHGEAQDAIG